MALIEGGEDNDLLFGIEDEYDEIFGHGGDDQIDGGWIDVGNHMDGGAGNDSIMASDGADTIIGGDGVDTLSYIRSPLGVLVNLATNEADRGDAYLDTISGFENVEGSDGGDDILIGSAAENILQGNWGADRLQGGAGADTLDGGGGLDTVDYRNSSAGVTVDLARGIGTGGDAQGDSIRGVENAEGSRFADTLTGDAGANILDGLAGGDVLTGRDGDDVLRGGAGADYLDGGDDIDTASYFTSSTGVAVNLATGTGSGGYAQGDALVGIENLSGSLGNDSLVGNSGVNALRGGNGNDVLTGAGGRDTLTGGVGADRFVYGSAAQSPVGAGADRITDFSHAQGDRVDLRAIDANAGAAGDQAFRFIGTGAYTHHAGELRYAVANGVTTIAGDINGDGTSDFHIVLTGSIGLQAADFML